MVKEFKRRLNYTDKKWGLISVAGYRELFPPPSSPVTIVDEKGNEYQTKMHSQSARIDGLTDWYHNHPDADIGDLILTRVEDSGKVFLALQKPPSVVDSEGTKEIAPRVSTEIPVEQQIEIVPSLEKTLEDILERNIEKLEDGLRIYVDETEIPARQYSTDVGIIDLLCLDRQNNFVVVELKRQSGSDATIGQIARYMGWVKKHLARPEQRVRGIIVAKEVDDKLTYALEVLEMIKVKEYRIDLKFV